jgi:outer membrane lipoprotein-sorting protein
MIKNASITFSGWRLAFLVGAALLVSAEAAAQTRTLTAAQVVAKNIAARGGLEAWRSIHALSFTGKIDAGRTHPEPEGTVDNPPSSSPKRHMLEKAMRDARSASAGTVIALPYRIELKRPRKVRVELDFAGQTAVQVYDGTTGWYTRPYLGYSTPRPFSAAELKLAADQQDLDGLLIDAAAKGNQISMEGTEAVEGRRAYKLKVTLKNGDVRHVWVDAESFLDVEVDGTRQIGTRARKMTTILRDYRKVDGVMIPFLMETTGEGIKQSEKIVIEKATVNPDLPDSRFARPSGAGAG